MKAWIFFWAYVYEFLGLLDRLWDWAAWHVDHNNYLAGFVFGVVLFAIPYLIGILDIVWR